MENVYEKIRINMNSTWPLKLPKHEKVLKLLELIFPAEEAELIALFKSPLMDVKSARKIAKLLDLSEEEVNSILERMAKKGTILKSGKTRFSMMPIMPGLFEFYFVAGKGENIKEAAKVFHEVVDLGLLNEWYNSRYPFFRTVPSSSLSNKIPTTDTKSDSTTIEIDQQVDSHHKILIYEDILKYIEEASSITVVNCACRTTAALLGDKCDKPLDVCMALNFASEALNAYGLGKNLTKEEAIQTLKRAEDHGLVHTVINSAGLNSQMFICNCCTCHCGVLSGLTQFNNPNAFARSNFRPEIDKTICKMCEKCVEICPMDAMWHHWPHNKELSDEFIAIKDNRCIGCGLCAHHCPTNAIKMIKVYDDKPVNDLLGVFKKMEETKNH
ncbi:MAG: 4Fe-4S dicluster domain-containing protein [Promethearchaeota archaeon]|nr:MAG: 4Fe-4S dicluster domain-containing protein [Candidatus Lokiarchaeota archaeon]